MSSHSDNSNSNPLLDMTVYLNGQYLPLREATVSVCDRGFLFGDGVYEVIKAYRGKPLALDAHLKRLSNSLEAIQLPLDMENKDWEAIITTLLQKNTSAHKNGDEYQVIYLQVTRGADHLTRHHHFPETVTPTVFARVSPITPIPFSKIKKGFKAITAEDTRWSQCHIKSITLLPNVLLMQKARQADAIEVILLREGKAIEGSTSNLFIVESGTLITPPLKPYMLGGITRQIILDLAKAHAIPYAERTITQSALRHADEIWITSSIREIIPIVQLDSHSVGNGRVGPLWHTMIELYQNQLPE